MKIVIWNIIKWPLLVLSIIVLIPFYYFILIILVINALFKIDEIGKVKKFIALNKIFGYVYYSIIFLLIICLLCLLFGAMYFTPNAFVFWSFIINLKFNDAIIIIVEPILGYKENISSTAELIFTLIISLISVLIFALVYVSLLRLYQIIFEKKVNDILISVLKYYGYLIFEVKYSLEMKNSDSTESNLLCELCETKCINEKYTHRTYSEKEINNLVEKDMLNTTKCLPSLDNTTINKCKYKWTKKIISLVDSNDINRRIKIKKGDILFVD